MAIYTDGVILRNGISWDDFYAAPVFFVEKSLISHLLLLVVVAIVAFLLIRRLGNGEANKIQKITGLLSFFLLAYLSFILAESYRYSLVSYLNKLLPNSIYLTKTNSSILNINWQYMREIVNLIYGLTIAIYIYKGIKLRERLGAVVNSFWKLLVKLYKQI